MSIEIELRYPTVAFGYAEARITGETAQDVERQLAEAAKTIGLAIQLAGGGDSHAQAERLIMQELGGVKVNEDGSPWTEPQAPVQQPWSGGPPVESVGPPPFGPGASTAPSFGPGGAVQEKDHFLIEVPREKMDTWKATDRPWLQKELPRGFVDWDGDAKRNTIKKSAGDQYLNWLRTNGYALR